MLSKIPRIILANLPSPLNEAPALAKEIGLDNFFIKRDDLTGFACGGTKVRKLEYDLAEILKNKYDIIITAGGVQSNHARLTAAAARKFHLDVKLVLGGREIHSFDGNLLLDILFGAEIRFLANDDDNDHLTAAMEDWGNELRKKGANPYISPIGGSSALGSIGCINAVKELAAQMNTFQKVQIILPVGSCGTFAGIILGARLYMPNSRIIGISISRLSPAIKIETLKIIRECCCMLNIIFDFNENEIESYDNYFEEYGIPTSEGQEALIKCAYTEGIILDPIYTGKTMAGLIDLVKKGILDKNLPTVFLHTGGLPILFSFESEFRKLANIKNF
jgi:D-cysteine desulfhydrase